MSPVFLVHIHICLCNFHTFNALGNLPSGKFPPLKDVQPPRIIV